MYDHPTPARDYFPGMGKSVADRTINRTIETPHPSAVSFSLAIADPGHIDRAVRAHAKSEGYALYDEDPYVVEEVVEPSENAARLRESNNFMLGDYASDVALEDVEWRVKGYFLPKSHLRIETWEDVAHRVAAGNASLDPRVEGMTATDAENLVGIEAFSMEHHLRQASLLMSGRHLQHGDLDQRSRKMELFTNCSTAATRHRLFELLLNGSGVGTLYADNLCKIVDYNKMPIVVPVIEWSHPDVASGEIRGYMTKKAAEHLYAGRKGIYHKVADSREGWGKAIELIDAMTFEKRSDEVLLLDFTGVRHRGQPIKGMQNRPASGPGPLMDAIANVARLRAAGMDPWRAAMYADHYLAECVLVGGARRAARMAVKPWDDETIFDFIELKRGGHLWSSNNSIGVTKEFWRGVEAVQRLIDDDRYEVFDEEFARKALFVSGVPEFSRRNLRAWQVFDAATRAAFEDGTGEPGFINVDLLNDNRAGIDAYLEGSFIDTDRNQVEDVTVDLYRALVEAIMKMDHPFIVNPCSEIVLLALGGYCTIADVVPFFAKNDADAEDAFRTAVRALIRTNTMDCLYKKEVARTNRIGVGMTGFHEWVWNRFKLGWKAMLEPDDTGRTMIGANGQTLDAPSPRALEMWLTLSRFAAAVSDEAARYSKMLGVVTPHTDRTVKPAGTTSKLFGLCEGVHLPSMREYLRWVQYRHDDPLIAGLKEKGYPTRDLKSYSGTTIVGFPTQPLICSLGMGNELVTAAEATPEEQYRFLELLETFWIRGVDLGRHESLGVLDLVPGDTGNQISYTLKYDPKVVDFDHFRAMILERQARVKCCSFMPQTDTSAYEYLPETPVTKDEYERIARAISGDGADEDIGLEHLDCGSGACPIDIRDEKAKAA